MESIGVAQRSGYPPGRWATLFDHSSSPTWCGASSGDPAEPCAGPAAGYARPMADTDPVTSPATDPAYAQGDEDAEPTMTASSGSRPDGALDPDPADEYADKPAAEGDS
jgi:hypothetical protein